ncbi:hypothetical protein AB0K51_12380 [Kitasatospora sp. NPDC049285]|uniref:hypothetical protein n=1 Tax=Kitasatospora sp. NPDC049285 TaxID=3157096 RepID=UPI0034400048
MGSLSPWRQHAGPAAARLDVTVPDQDDDQVPEVEYIRWLSQLQADLAQSINGVALRAARPVAIGVAPNGSQRPLSSAGRIVGWSVRETTGAAAVVRLWDGREAGGQLLGVIAFPAGAAANVMPSGGGINVSDALFVEVVTGTVEGVLYLGGVD